MRLRPILMTTAAMVLGVAPLLIASGAGAAARFSMGLVIAAGMSIGTIFTLFVVPMFYTLIARDKRTPAQAAEPAAVRRPALAAERGACGSAGARAAAGRLVRQGDAEQGAGGARTSSTEPSWAAASSAAMARPRPVPPGRPRAREGREQLPRALAGTPGPLSATSISTRPGSRRAGDDDPRAARPCDRLERVAAQIEQDARELLRVGRHR